MAWNEELYKQWIKFCLDVESLRERVPDCVSYSRRIYPEISVIATEEFKEAHLLARKIQNSKLYSLFKGR